MKSSVFESIKRADVKLHKLGCNNENFGHKSAECALFLRRKIPVLKRTTLSETRQLYFLVLCLLDLRHISKSNTSNIPLYIKCRPVLDVCCFDVGIVVLVSVIQMVGTRTA